MKERMMIEKGAPEMQEIADYLKGIRFKKKMVGGCDKEDVLAHMERVTEMYERVIEDLSRRTKEREKMLLKRKVQLEEMARANEQESEDESELDVLPEEKNETLEKVLAQLDNAKAEVIRKAQMEAKHILMDARLRASEEEEKIEKLRKRRVTLEKEYKLKVYETKEAIRKAKISVTKYSKDFQGMLDELALIGEGEENIIDLEQEKGREQRL